ncbi:MAG TPA: hypothetical protein VLR26_17280 [Frankiaceae bacterium]|nr:hypothetical protein [Frankiaceae bacterium]
MGSTVTSQPPTVGPGFRAANSMLYVSWDGKLRSVPFINVAPVGTPQPIPTSTTG